VGTEPGGYRRDHVRALVQRVELDAREVRIIGSKSMLLRTLAFSAKTAGFGVPSTEVADLNQGSTALEAGKCVDGA